MSETSSETMRTKTRLVLGRRHQLIDLNKEYVNFDINFEVRSSDASKDFEMLVINQEQLNTIDLTNLAMKKTRSGYISGNIVSDENKYQNYFLVIRALDEEPLDVDLDISIKPIPPKDEEQAPVMSPIQEDFLPAVADVAVDPSSSSQNSMWCKLTSSPFYIVVIILVIFGLCAAYYYYNKNKCASGEEHHGECAADVVEKAPSVVSSASSKSSKNSRILERLIKEKTTTPK